MYYHKASASTYCTSSLVVGKTNNDDGNDGNDGNDKNACRREILSSS